MKVFYFFWVGETPPLGLPHIRYFYGTPMHACAAEMCLERLGLFLPSSIHTVFPSHSPIQMMLILLCCISIVPFFWCTYRILCVYKVLRHGHYYTGFPAKKWETTAKYYLLDDEYQGGMANSDDLRQRERIWDHPLLSGSVGEGRLLKKGER